MRARGVCRHCGVAISRYDDACWWLNQEVWVYEDRLDVDNDGRCLDVNGDRTEQEHQPLQILPTLA